MRDTISQILLGPGRSIGFLARGSFMHAASLYGWLWVVFGLGNNNNNNKNNNDNAENDDYLHVITVAEHKQILFMNYRLCTFMYFERRDIVLIVGLLLFMIGLLPFMAPAYAAIIVIGMYLGIKVYVGKRRQMIQSDVGEGVCLECGSRIIDKKCSQCDSAAADDDDNDDDNNNNDDDDDDVSK